MSVCDFSALGNLTLKGAQDCIKRYCRQNGLWIHQFDTFFGTIRTTATPDKRITVLLSIVRDNGWNMNRKGQCAHIIEKVTTEEISKEELAGFWKTIDSLSKVSVRELPTAPPKLLEQLETTFGSIRKTLRRWHRSSNTLCFLTKVVLMFNWGQSPAFDSRVRSILKLPNDLSNEELVEALVEMGVWILDFELRNNIMLDELATNEMRQADESSLGQLPLGRGLDMLLFSLSQQG